MANPFFYCYIAAQSTPHQNCSVSSSPAAHLALFVGYRLALFSCDLPVWLAKANAFLTPATYQVDTSHDSISLLPYLKTKVYSASYVSFLFISLIPSTDLAVPHKSRR